MKPPMESRLIRPGKPDELPVHIINLNAKDIDLNTLEEKERIVDELSKALMDEINSTRND